MNDIFAEILDKDEHIVKVFKPNKKRFVIVNNIVSAIMGVLFSLPFIVLGILGLTRVIDMKDENGQGGVAGPIILLIFGIFMFLMIIFSLIMVRVRYGKTYYAYSNKRILIRTGFIGVDYAVIDMVNISTVTINVSLLDKFIKPNTGTIRFGSPSAPISGAGAKGGVLSGFAITAIEDAYVNYREIKEVIDNAKVK